MKSDSVTADLSVVTYSNSGKAFVWSVQMDSLLEDGVQRYGRDWQRVVEFINASDFIRNHFETTGERPSRDQCKQRWRCRTDPQASDKIKGVWSDDEVAALEGLVAESVDSRGKPGDADNWDNIAVALNRCKADVVAKWNSLRVLRMKRGPFTAAEDELICQRVVEWTADQKGLGIWAQLERQLGRKDKRISERWRNVLAKRPDVQQLVLIAMQDPRRVHQALQLQDSYRQQTQRRAQEEQQQSPFQNAKTSLGERAPHAGAPHSSFASPPPFGRHESYLTAAGNNHSHHSNISPTPTRHSTQHLRLSQLQTAQVHGASATAGDCTGGDSNDENDDDGGDDDDESGEEEEEEEMRSRDGEEQLFDSATFDLLLNWTPQHSADSSSGSGGGCSAQPVFAVSRAVASSSSSSHRNSGNLKWTPEMDKLLSEGVRRYRKKWRLIALTVNTPGADATKCRRRWARRQTSKKSPQY